MTGLSSPLAEWEGDIPPPVTRNGKTISLPQFLVLRPAPPNNFTNIHPQLFELILFII